MRHVTMLVLFALASCATSDDLSTDDLASSPSPNDEAAFRFFVDRGLTDVQVAGIVGNLDQESQMNPNAVQAGGPGRGIAQWSVGGRWDNLVAHANQTGRSPWSLDLQLEYVWLELVSYPQFGLAELQAATTVEAATIAFQDRFERCGICHQATRIAYAYAALAAYGGGTTRRYAFQANTTELWTQGGPTGLGMMPGTSPAIAGAHVAFQANTGELWVDGAPRGLGMMAGTSPSVSADGGVAFQANTTELWVNYAPTGLGMMAGTSPDIAGGNVAFQANTGELWVNYAPTGLGMMSATSPSIADDGTVAFQANTGELWIGGAPTGLGMMAGTSPSIATLSGGGHRWAFQANTGELWIDGAPTGLGMMASTSPSVAPNGHVVFQANTTELWLVDGTGGHPLGLGMATGTSPAN
jgi:hypothetical protein